MQNVTKLRGWPARLVSPLLALGLSACAHSASPSFTLFGTFFPAWLVCGLIGIVIAIIARIAMIALKLSTILPFQLFVCSSIGLIGALLTWITWFGQ
ncbi:YtcA family lipoprotein [Undibacterium sp. Ji67W]|uniref:YtcA family lipoprotein n=1 Tax=Undibacterium sp. Ji67W TaxID=3413042 RepID=UPI003BF0BCC6